MYNLGFMQGRLTNKGGFYPQKFPMEQWEQEFTTAVKIGFDCMEWMFNFEQWNENPIVNETGISKIRRLIEETGIDVSGICANYFMHKNIYDSCAIEENISILLELVKNAELIGCPNIIIPLFEASEIQLGNEVLRKIIECVSSKRVSILLETDCEIESVYQWFVQLLCKNVGLCYDIGNAAGLGRDIVQELTHYSDIVKNVHIKDKKKGGSTVLLGQGDAPIGDALAILKEKKYKGCYILESYYGLDAIEDTKKNYTYVKELLRR